MTCNLSKCGERILVQGRDWHFAVPTELLLDANGVKGHVTEVSEDEDHVVLRVDDEQFAYISKEKLWELRQ